MLLSCQTFSQTQEFLLPNGLKILVKEDHRAPVAVSMLWYKVGSADEPGGLTGISHAIEHMMFKGTKHYPLGVFSKSIAAAGGQANAFTGKDYTVFFEKINKTELAASFQLEADRMHHLLFDPDEFAKEMQVIQEERRLRTDDNPQALLLERFLATIHLTSAYSHPVIGWMSDLQQMELSDLHQWYQKYYAPNNATLVVVGDVHPQEVYLLAKQYFARVPLSPSPMLQRKGQEEPRALGEKSVQIQTPAKLPLLIVGYLVPSLKTAKETHEAYALELIAAALDEGASARFPKNLIRGKLLATEATSYYNPQSRYQTEFILYGIPSQNRTISDLQKGLSTELEKLKKEPLTEQELQKIKTQLIAQKTFEQDSIFAQAMELGLLETVGIGWQKAEEYTQAINAVNAQQIQETAKHYFQEKNKTVAQLQPQRQNQEAL